MSDESNVSERRADRGPHAGSRVGWWMRPDQGATCVMIPSLSRLIGILTQGF